MMCISRRMRGMPPSRFEATMKRWLAEPPSAAVEAHCFYRHRLRQGAGGISGLAAAVCPGDRRGTRSWPGAGGSGQSGTLGKIGRGGCLHRDRLRGCDRVCAAARAVPSVYSQFVRRAGAAGVLLEELEKRAEAGAGRGRSHLPECGAIERCLPTSPHGACLWDEAFALSEEDMRFEPVYGAEGQMPWMAAVIPAAED